MIASTLAAPLATPATNSVQTFELPTWRRDAPPTDGMPIIAMGNITEKWNAHFVAIPFAKAIRYETDCAEPCWVDFYSRLSLTEEPSDTVTIHAWTPLASLLRAVEAAA